MQEVGHEKAINPFSTLLIAHDGIDNDKDPLGSKDQQDTSVEP